MPKVKSAVKKSKTAEIIDLTLSADCDVKDLELNCSKADTPCPTFVNETGHFNPTQQYPNNYSKRKKWIGGILLDEKSLSTLSPQQWA